MLARSALRADPRLAFSLTGYRIPGSRSPIRVLNELLVKFREGRDIEGLAALRSLHGLDVIRPADPQAARFTWKLRFAPSAQVDPLAISVAVARHPSVEYASPNMIAEVGPTYTPTDPLFASQFYLANSHMLYGVTVDVNVRNAWDYTLGNAPGGMAIAVVDDGVQASHPDFGGQVEFGYDTWGNNSPGCFGCANNPAGSYSHGTQVAGIIAGQHNNGKGVAGVAPLAFIYPVRILRHEQPTPPPTDEQIADGIDTAWELGIVQVMNNSWGYTAPGYQGNPVVTAAIQRATTLGRGGKGTVVVFSAGNPSNRIAGVINPVLYPARLPEVIAVSAINNVGGVSNYSPQGNEIDLVAPSSHSGDFCVGEVFTTDLAGSNGCNSTFVSEPFGVDYTGTFSGTSAAAPQVSGIAALLLSREPNLTLAQVKQRLYATARAWGAANTYGNGLVSGAAVMGTALTVTISGPSSVQQNQTCTWSAQPSGGLTPYTNYAWTKNWAPVGTNSSVLNLPSGTSSFTLRVTVTDTFGTQALGSKSVTVSGSAPPCQL